MQCPQCGTTLPEDARFCRACGADVSAANAAAAPPPVAPVAPPGPVTPAPAMQPTAPMPAVPGAAPPPPGAPAGGPYTPPPAYPPQGGYAPQPGYAPPPAYAPAPVAPPKKGNGLVIGIVSAVVVLLLICGGVAAFFLWPRSTPKPIPAPTPTSTVAATTTPAPTQTSTAANPDNTAAEQAVTAFYAAINAGDLTTVRTLVTPDAAVGVDPGAFEGWTTTNFEVARSVVDGDTAYVFGRESQREFGSPDLGVKFTLQRSSGTWLISAWNAVDEATVNGNQPSNGQGVVATGQFDANVARDTVKALLDARRAGNANKIRSLTTAKFQKAYGDVWLDGIKTAPYFYKYTFLSSKASGAAYVVKYREDWNSGAETGTYTVVQQSGAVLVDTWDSQ